jgi:hypothetical protein
VAGEINVTLTEGDDGEVLVHDPKCPMVQEHRETGRMIATMIGYPAPLPPHLKLHTCLSGSKGESDG